MATATTTRGDSIDFVVIIIYFVVVLGFGSFFGRFSRSTRDFFFSGQRFSWWLIAMSLVATAVGSYSFVKYSQKGFQYGMSSSMTYMNDWFFQPFFMFGWLPIIYFSRVRSIPDYFQRRFDTKSRMMATIIILMWMIGYIGYNFYTLGTVAQSLLGVDIYAAIAVIAVVSAIYIAAGGQTAVIFTDLLQGAMLLIAGFTILVLGLGYLGGDGNIIHGLVNLWANMDLSERLPFAGFSSPPDFHFVGVFWQDGVANSITFLFISQGLIMRFMAAKSMTEGRRTILANVLFLMPLSMIVVNNAGWVGNAAAHMGLIDPATDPKEAFVTVAEKICTLPGMFGFVLAALCAALMSTIDTLTNACAAIFVYDIYEPYVKRGRSDRHYLFAARLSSLATSAVGLVIGFVFVSYGTDLYKAHATFTSIVTPPIVAAVFLGAFWKRFTPAAAFWSMFAGALLVWSSKAFPILTYPFAALHGVEPGKDGGYGYMTAFFGLFVCCVIGVVISLITKPKPEAEIAGLWVGSINAGRRFFKGSEPSFEYGKPVVGDVEISKDGVTPPNLESITMPDAPAGQPPASYPTVRLSEQHMQKLKADPGDILFVADARRYLGGLRSLHCRAGQSHASPDQVFMHEEAFDAGRFVKGRRVRIEKLL